MKFLVYLSEEQAKQLDELSLGRKRQEVLRGLIDTAYKKAFPAYTKPKGEVDPFADLTPERYCTDVMGGVVDGDMCVINKPNGSEITYPLDKIKSFKP